MAPLLTHCAQPPDSLAFPATELHRSCNTHHGSLFCMFLFRSPFLFFEGGHVQDPSQSGRHRRGPLVRRSVLKPPPHLPSLPLYRTKSRTRGGSRGARSTQKAACAAALPKPQNGAKGSGISFSRSPKKFTAESDFCFPDVSLLAFEHCARLALHPSNSLLTTQISPRKNNQMQRLRSVSPQRTGQAPSPADFDLTTLCVCPLHPSQALLQPRAICRPPKPWTRLWTRLR